MLRMASSAAWMHEAKDCRRHLDGSRCFERRRMNTRIRAARICTSVQKHISESRWRSFVFLVRLSAPLDALLLREPPPRTPQSRLTHIISCSPAALAMTRTLSASRARRALPPDSACVLVLQVDA